MTVQQCRNPNPGFRAPPSGLPPPHLLPTRRAGYPAHLGPEALPKGPTADSSHSYPFHFSHMFATLEANPQSPGQKNLKATSLGVFCVGWFIFFCCFYFNFPIGVFPFFYNGHFLLSKFRNIFPLVSPRISHVASSG